PDGKGLPPIELASLSSSTERQGAELEEKFFDAIGVKLKINYYSWPEFLATIKNKKSQMYSFAWQADYPDAENFLQLFYSKNVSPGSNDANYSNPEFDRLYEKSLTLTDSLERTTLYKQMAKIVVEDCPWIFGAHRLIYTLAHPWLKNFKPNEFEHNRHKYLRIDQSLKK
ncbi:MAG: ABC transporter substrate-binding protein, partial [Bdellovibrio sp.]|nr:ABC transporter substrate-binding protein [Bdellovibrio sp.]